MVFIMCFSLTAHFGLYYSSPRENSSVAVAMFVCERDREREGEEKLHEEQTLQM